jgi:hypothetical protein
MRFCDSAGNEFVGYGLYATLSYDEGRTWPTRKLMTPGGPPCDQTSIDNSTFRLSATNAEPCGYLALCQVRDGVIHLISSKLHCSFNLVWLEVPA